MAKGIASISQKDDADDFDGQKPMNRRELLRVGTLGLGGLSLSSLLGVKALAKGQPNPLTGKSVIFLFQQGGPSQHETFDPKPDTTSGVRSVGEVIPTSVPGTHFSGWMPRLTKLADKFTVVRSFSTENSGHNIQPIVSRSSREANIGGHYSRVAGVTLPNSGVPTNVVLFPRSVDVHVPGRSPAETSPPPARTARGSRRSSPARASNCRSR